MLDIVTSIAIDTDPSGAPVDYPALAGRLSDKRQIYWICAVVCLRSSQRMNPDQHHVLYTNDPDPVVIDGVDVRAYLEAEGIEVHQLEFEHFDPGTRSRRFRNAFYKFEVIAALAEADRAVLLIDADVVWARPGAELVERIEASPGAVFLQDTYAMSEHPRSRRQHGLSLEDLRREFATFPILPRTSRPPVWWGGELVAAHPHVLVRIAEALRSTFAYAVEQHDAGTPVTFRDGSTLFDGMERMGAYVYNGLDLDIVDTNGRYSARLQPKRVAPTDPRLASPIWHMPAAKAEGFPRMYAEILDPASSYWATDIADVPHWVSERVDLGTAQGDTLAVRAKKVLYRFPHVRRRVGELRHALRRT